MEMGPHNYWDETDGLYIPELYFQYKFPDVSFNMYNSLIPNDTVISVKDFDEILNKYIKGNLISIARHFRFGFMNEVLIDEESKTLIWRSMGAKMEITDKIEESRRENESCKMHIKLDEYTEIYMMTVVSDINGPLQQEFFSEVYENCNTVASDLNNLVFTLGSSPKGLKIDSHYIKLSTYGEDIIDSNYNDDFQEAYETILEFLYDNSSGLVLLDGDPGTGKTSIIKHFISMCTNIDKRIIIVPSAFASVLSDPSFLSFATVELKDSILLLEDAETALASRTGHHNDSVSNILNLSDGILGDVLSVKIIATINTSDSIDKALFRAGRLVAKYTFKKLKLDKAKKLASKLNVNPDDITEDITLAEIYNRSPNKFGEDNTDNKIGFKRPSVINKRDIVLNNGDVIPEDAIIDGPPQRKIGFGKQ